MVESSAQAASAAASHSGRIKYADPRDLPSYPSSGLRPDGAAAGAAATLGWSNQKQIESWKPDKSSSASAAAALAKDYKVGAQWEPSAHPAGHKAALLAVGSAGAALKQHQQQPAPTNKGTQESWGNSAATQAFNAQRAAAEALPNLSGGSSAATQAFHTSKSSISGKKGDASGSNTTDRSLAAAKGAMDQARVPGPTSSPSSPRQEVTSPDLTAQKNALSGASLAHRASLQPKPHNEAGAVPVTTMTRNMFTSHPPVKPEVDEADANERLRQSAVAMAKKMYQQQKLSEQNKDGQGDGTSSGGQYLSLQDAAYKQAQERLAKLEDEHQKGRDMQEYYGNATSPSRKRFSMAGSVTNKLRRRSSGDDDDDDDDRHHSERIRKEMSIFSNKLSEIDHNKRDQDRETLLAAAQRNVKARLQGMDQKVYNETGKMSQNMVNDWQLKARESAAARSEERNEKKGMIDIGGGKYMDPEEINAIAAKRMQPWLDEVNEKAEAKREQEAALKLEEENKREEAAKEKARDKEIKDINKQLKEQEKQDAKAKKLQAKEEEKARKEQEKAAKAEQKRLAKEEKRKSKQDSTAAGPDTEKNHSAEDGTSEHPLAATEVAPEDREGTESEIDGSELAGHATERENDAPARTNEGHAQEAIAETDAVTAEETNPDAEASAEPSDEKDGSESKKSNKLNRSSTSKVKGWIRDRFSRGKSISEGKERKRGSFMGGAGLRQGSIASSEHRTSSMRDVALAGKDNEETPTDPAEVQDSQGISPVSSVEDVRTGRKTKDVEDVEPPTAIKDPNTRTSSSPTRDSRFREEM